MNASRATLGYGFAAENSFTEDDVDPRRKEKAAYTKQWVSDSQNSSTCDTLTAQNAATDSGAGIGLYGGPFIPVPDQYGTESDVIMGFE